ncbi:MAG: methyltransferase domain-containing protein [bacterium]
MYTKAAQQYDFKVKEDLLNQLPFLFDHSLTDKSLDELLMQYYIFHHYGLTLHQKTKQLQRKNRYFPLNMIDIRNLKQDQELIARELYQQELNQTEYFIKQISKYHQLSGQRVLDIGAGSGGMSFYLTENFHCQTTMLNLSKEQVKLLKRIITLKKIAGKANVVAGNMNALSSIRLATTKFDLILQNETDMYITSLSNFLANIGKLLSADGCYATISWYKTRESQNIKNIDRYYFTAMKNLEYFRGELIDQNFKIIQEIDLTEYAKPYWYLRNTFQHAKGFVEAEFIGGLENGSLKYQLIIAKKNGVR